MRIAGVEWNLNHAALELYVAGCTIGCPGCHNPELQDFRKGDWWTDVVLPLEPQLIEMKDAGLIQNVWLLGGEPLDQPHAAVNALLRHFDTMGLTTWLWTGYDYEDVPQGLLTWTDYLKTGCYDSESPGYKCPLTGIQLASGNQKIQRITRLPPL